MIPRRVVGLNVLLFLLLLLLLDGASSILMVNNCVVCDVDVPDRSVILLELVVVVDVDAVL